MATVGHIVIHKQQQLKQLESRMRQCFLYFLGAQINLNEYYFNYLMSSSSFSGNYKSLEVKNCKLRSCVSQLTGYTKGCNLYMYTFMTPISNIGYVNLTSEFIIGYKGDTADNSAANEQYIAIYIKIYINHTSPASPLGGRGQGKMSMNGHIIITIKTMTQRPPQGFHSRSTGFEQIKGVHLGTGKHNELVRIENKV